MLRYMNQMGDSEFTDHQGFEHPVQRRNDIYSHRVMVFLKGWVGDPKIEDQTFQFTVAGEALQGVVYILVQAGVAYGWEEQISIVGQCAKTVGL